MKYLIGLVLLVGILWATNPSEIQHKQKVKELMRSYITRLNQPFIASGNADSTARGLRAVEGFELMADAMIEEAISVNNYSLFSLTVDKKGNPGGEPQNAGLGILGKVYLFDSFASQAKL